MTFYLLLTFIFIAENNTILLSNQSEIGQFKIFLKIGFGLELYMMDLLWDLREWSLKMLKLPNLLIDTPIVQSGIEI